MKILLANKLFFYKGASEYVFFDTADLLAHKEHNIVIFSIKRQGRLLKPSKSRYILGTLVDATSYEEVTRRVITWAACW
jgi:hypothetical protein